MRVPLLAVSLWLLAVPLGAGAQVPPQPPFGEGDRTPVTGDSPVPGAPAGVGAHEHAGHPVPPTGAVGMPPDTGGSGTTTQAAPDEKKPAACPCQSEDATGPCPCPHQQDAQACPCKPEGATGTCPCPHHAEHMARMQQGQMGPMMCRPVGKSKAPTP
jgi:hypothetical protein